jgi:hypothetical protein
MLYRTEIICRLPAGGSEAALRGDGILLVPAVV